jgi:hypothetical protein
MTKADLALIEAARAFHSEPGDLPGEGRILTGGEASTSAPFKAWAGTCLSTSFDRMFDETAATFDRFTALRERDRKSRKNGSS